MKVSLSGARQGWIPSATSCSWGGMRLMILRTWWMAEISDDRLWVTGYRCRPSKFPKPLNSNSTVTPLLSSCQETSATAALVCHRIFYSASHDGVPCLGLLGKVWPLTPCNKHGYPCLWSLAVGSHQLNPLDFAACLLRSVLAKQRNS